MKRERKERWIKTDVLEAKLEIITDFSKDEYRFLSNFFACSIELDGCIYSSVEHAYQSAKSMDKEWKTLCADASTTSGRIKRASRNITIREDWDDIKLGVMEHCLREKFMKEPFCSLILATKNAVLEEGNTWNDTFWGIDLRTGIGENNLGKLLMKIREELKTNNSL